MAFGTLSDMSKIQAEVVFFPSIYKKNKNNIVNDSLFWIKGRVSFEEKGKPKIIAEDVVPLEFVRSKMLSKVHIRLVVDEVSEDDLKKVKGVIEKHRGNIPLWLHIVTEKRTYQASSYEYATDGSQELIDSLRNILGETEVWIS